MNCVATRFANNAGQDLAIIPLVGVKMSMDFCPSCSSAFQVALLFHWFRTTSMDSSYRGQALPGLFSVAFFWVIPSFLWAPDASGKFSL